MLLACGVGPTPGIAIALSTILFQRRVRRVSPLLSAPGAQPIGGTPVMWDCVPFTLRGAYKTTPNSVHGGLFPTFYEVSPYALDVFLGALAVLHLVGLVLLDDLLAVLVRVRFGHLGLIDSALGLGLDFLVGH